MKIPPNYGTAYSKAFENNYKMVSQQYKVKLLPFFLEGVKPEIKPDAKRLVHPSKWQSTAYFIKFSLSLYKRRFIKRLYSDPHSLIRSQKTTSPLSSEYSAPTTCNLPLAIKLPSTAEP